MVEWSQWCDDGSHIGADGGMVTVLTALQFYDNGSQFLWQWWNCTLG